MVFEDVVHASNISTALLCNNKSARCSEYLLVLTLAILLKSNVLLSSWFKLGFKSPVSLFITNKEVSVFNQ